MLRLDINYKEKNYKKHKHVEAKQYAAKQPMDHWRNQRGNKKHLEKMPIKIKWTKTYGMQQKQF